MACGNCKSVRFQDDLQYNINGSGLPEPSSAKGENDSQRTRKSLKAKVVPEPSSGKGEKDSQRTGESLKAKMLLRVFSEDHERVKKNILDPRGPSIGRWNKIFLVASLVSLFVDPLFFYSPLVHENMCIDIGNTLDFVLTIIRSVADTFYVIQIFVSFRTAYVAPSSRVFGRGELVIDSTKIALRYLSKSFWIDVVAALPLPQVLIWAVIPSLRGSTLTSTKYFLRFIIIFQYLPRLFLIFPPSSQIVKAAGVVTKTAWAGAAYYLMLFMLASHVIGAGWYLLSIDRQEACWKYACNLEKLTCQYSYFHCRMISDPNRNLWFQSSNITTLCDPNQSSYPFGMYGDAVTFNVTSAKFFNKYIYCFWWGLRNLSTLGQGLITSIYVGENTYAIIIGTLGLVLLALLIGNMQRYLQSTIVRLEEWRIMRTDTEQWMHHRQLPQELRQSVQKYHHYKWVATGGVDEAALLDGLPLDLRRDIKRHLCYDLVRRVPLFDQMDDSMLDAICERLKPTLCSKSTCVVREGDTVNEMLFIIRGNLDSYTTNGGRTGFFNSCRIGPGDFCGEELLTWALDPRPSVALPSSTRTVKAISDAEAFALRAEDLKFVASQFRRLHSKQLRHTFRFYSHQWQTWAACFIQAAWRRYKTQKSTVELKAREGSLLTGNETSNAQMDVNAPLPGSGSAFYAAILEASARFLHKHSGSESSAVSSLKKPTEPDFSVYDE